MTVPPASPALAAYHAEKDTREKEVAIRRRQRWIGMALALLLLAGGMTYVSFEAHEIRDTQVTNTLIAAKNSAKQEQRDNCQIATTNALIKDVPLAFSGDKNPKDYSKVHKC